MSGKHRTRRPVWRAGIAVGLVAAVAALVVTTVAGGPSRKLPTASSTLVAPPERALLIVRGVAGPLVAVVASGGSGPPAAVIVPATVSLTIPGQGDGRVLDVAGLPPSDAALAVSNLLGVWIPHAAVTDPEHMAAVVDRAGGVETFGTATSGAEVERALDQRGAARGLAWREVLDGLFSTAPPWSSDDFVDTDDAGAVALVLQGAKGASVASLPTVRAAAGFLRPDPDKLIGTVAEQLGGSLTPPVPVIVLNGAGTPGVGRAVAERLVPAGFRVTVSENASDFDHATTLIVAGTPADQGEADRVRDLLGAGTVSVAGVPSGLGDVTIVVGTDFQTG